MSLYNMLFGQNQQADLLLFMLGLTREDVGRFRDAYVSEGKIMVYTRNGGGNREYYEDVFERLQDHPLYLGDYDDDFDCTYATIEFSFPEEFRQELEAMDSGRPWDPSGAWTAALEAISKGELPEVEERMRPVIESIARFVGGMP